MRAAGLCALFLSVSAVAAPFAEMWQPRPTPAPAAGPAAPAASGVSVTVRLHPEQPIRRFSPALLGNNAAVWDGDRLLTPATEASLVRSGLRLLRFPGGSTSDVYCWDGNYTSQRAAYGSDNSVYNGAWAVDTDEFIALCRAVGAEPMFTVNLGLARYGSPAEGAALAAAWVRYCNVTKGYGVRYWEVGNENYGDWEMGTIFPPGSQDSSARLTGAQYGALFNQYAAAMKAVDPTIRIGAVSLGVDSEDAYNGYFGWMRQMLPVVQDTADYLSVHNYFVWLGGTAQSTPQALFANVGQIAQWKSNLDAMVAKYTHRQPGDLPYAMTEYNVENPPKHDTVELTNGLFTAMAIGEFARTGWAAANLWDVLNGWDANTGGDHAFLSVGQPGVADGTQRASLYALALWSQFGDTLIAADSSLSTVKAYGGTYSDGGRCAVLVNTSTQPYTVALDPGPARHAPDARLWTLTADGFTRSQVRFNGVLGPAGGGPTELPPPYILATVAPGALTVGLPAGSASLVVIPPWLVVGDADSDGAVTLADAVLAARIASGLLSPTDAQRHGADADSSGAVTPSDAALIAGIAAGLR